MRLHGRMYHRFAHDSRDRYAALARKVAPTLYAGTERRTAICLRALATLVRVGALEPCRVRAGR